MTDQKLEALPCPFCGHKADLEDDDTLYPSGIYWRETDGIRHYISHRNRQEGDGEVWGMHCPEVAGGCGVEIYGDTKEEALEKWNRRALTSEEENLKLRYLIDIAYDHLLHCGYKEEDPTLSQLSIGLSSKAT